MAERRIIISFTSYPSRIGSVHLVVESLFRQTVHADEIILYLSIEEFPKAEDNLPVNLKNLIGMEGFRIEWVEGNLKSHKKYYYVLQKYRDDIVITVDDDMVYTPFMVYELVESWKRFPKAVSARRARVILKKDESLEEYHKWDGYLDEYVNMPRMDLCAIGVGGVCYSPGCADKNWFDKKTIEIAENQDDLWLKYNEVLNHIPVVYTMPSQKDLAIDSAKENCLFHSNLRGGNDSCVEALLEIMKTENPCCYAEWFYSLMTWEEYAAQKKEYYRNILKADFDKAQGAEIYFYGAGAIAKYLLDRLSILRLTGSISAIIVSDKGGNPSELEGIEVRQLDEIDKEKRFGVIFGVSESNRKQIETALKEYDYCPIELNDQAFTRYFNIISIWQYNTTRYGEK